VQGPKFKILLPRSCSQTHRIYMPSFIDVGRAVSEGFKNVTTEWTDRWTDGRILDRFY